MNPSDSRTVRLIGPQGRDALQAAHVLIVGVGGVGGSVFEMLLRAGVGALTVVDGDVFDETNLNRQLLCTVNDIGRYKVHVAAERGASVRPQTRVTPMACRYTAASSETIFAAGPYTAVADCIDSVADKVHLIESAQQRQLPIVSAMGAGNRLQPQFAVTDIYRTANDGLARAVRTRLRRDGVKALKTVCDSGLPQASDGLPGSISYAPNMMGCLLAAEIIKDVLCRFSKQAPS